jgi:hypothetical protein
MRPENRANWTSDAAGSINAGWIGVRALWTIWSVVVQVHSGALAGIGSRERLLVPLEGERLGHSHHDRRTGRESRLPRAGMNTDGLTSQRLLGSGYGG